MSLEHPITEGEDRAKESHRSGYATLIGRPNVGKSTLLNRLVGAKLAIVAEKPETTRRRLVGIRSFPEAQILWVDTPGLHHRPPVRNLMNRRMAKAARANAAEADVAVLVIDGARGFGPDDARLAGELAERRRPWIVTVNKIDQISNAALLALLAMLGDRQPGVDVVPVSAKTGKNVAALESLVVSQLPLGPSLYDDDDLTDEPARVMVEEFVREQVFALTGEEVPYRSAVLVERFVEKPEQRLNVVDATILVERESQKRILIGAGGRMIRQIGTHARQELEDFFGVRFYLNLFVKVRRDWTGDPRVLDELGI